MQIRVRYADTDAMGVVYHGNYLSFLEAARIEALRSVGGDYAALVEGGLQAPVVEAHVRYLKPAVFDDVILVYAWVSDLGRVRFSFSYRALRQQDQALLATANTVHACVDAASLRPVRVPAAVRMALQRLVLDGAE